MSARCLRLTLAVLVLLSPAGHAIAASPADSITPDPPTPDTDNLYFVGSRDLASYLVVTPAGNILINTNVPSSPSQIRRSVEQLGFRWTDIRILLISHAHVDHAGGSAAVRKQTGARLEVMQGDADVVESGGRTDFAFGGPGKPEQFPPAHVDHVLQNGEKVSLGGVTLTAVRTPGHTRGCTTWTMQAHVPGEPAGVLRHVVIVGSWYVLPRYRLIAMHSRPPSYPGIAGDFTATFAALHALPCDLFLGAHGSYFNMLAKLRRMPIEGDEVWIDPEGYKRALADAEQGFRATLERQTAQAKLP